MTYLDIAARGRNAAWRYAVSLPLALVLTFLFGLVITLPLALLHVLPPDLGQQMQHATRPVTFFAGAGGTFALVLAGFMAAIALLHKKSFGDIIGQWRWRAWAQGAGAWTLALAAATMIDFVVAPKGFAVTASAQTPMLVAVAIPSLAVQTFAEEFVFRGYFTQGLLLATRRPLPAVILSGLVFGSAHIPNGWPEAANAVVFGVALALIAIHTRGLAFGFGVHMINNLYGAVVVVSGGDVFSGSPGLVTQTTPGLMWWDTLTGAVALAVVTFLVLKGRIAKGGDSLTLEAPADAFS